VEKGEGVLSRCSIILSVLLNGSALLFGLDLHLLFPIARDLADEVQVTSTRMQGDFMPWRNDLCCVHRRAAASKQVGVESEGAQELRSAACQAAWHASENHPWPLLKVYTAALLLCSCAGRCSFIPREQSPLRAHGHNRSGTNHPALELMCTDSITLYLWTYLHVAGIFWAA